MRTKLKYLFFCMFFTFYTEAFAQSFPSETKSETCISTTGDTSFVKSDKLNRIWRPTFHHMLQIPENSTLKLFIKLESLLKNSRKFKNSNTLIICSEKNISLLREVCEDKFVILSELIIPINKNMNPEIIEASVCSLSESDKKKWQNYDYKFIKTKIYN